MNKVPKLRFQGFEGEWEEKKFTDITTRLSQSEKSGALPGVEFEDIVSGQGILNKKIEEKTCNKIGKLFSAGDVLFGKLRPYLRNILLPNFDGVAIGDFWVLHPEGIDSKLLYEIVNSDKFMAVANVSSGSKMPRADWDFVSNAIVAIPTNKFEQQRIASYFTHLDTLIEASRKKVEKYKQVKAASLQTLFPKHGECVPKLRFKGCEGEWKKVSFEEVFDFLKNNSLSRAELSDEGSVMNVHYGDVLIKYPEFLDVTQEKMTYVKDSLLADKLYKSCPLQDGDVVIADAAEDETVGKCTELLNVDSTPIVSGLHTIPVRPRFSFASKYLGFFLNSNLFHDQLLVHIQGSKISSISRSAILKTFVYFPSLQEQHLIAQYFTHMDALLTFEQQRYEKLQQVKQASLSQMFVS